MIKMKNLKIIILATTIAIIAVATVGVTLAHSYNDSPYYGMTGYTTTDLDDDWWTEMEEHMEDNFNEVDQTTDGYWWDQMKEHMEEHLDEGPQEIQDQEWFNDMRTYMEQHINEVQTQDWFNEMTQFMEENFCSGYRYSYSPSSYGRGCMGW
jgi:hypothetical protein